MAIFCNFAPNLRFYMKLYSDAELAEILDKDIFHKIGEAADGMGVECYLVGGYVRDIFLERPTNDIDVVVVGSGIEVAKKLQQLLGTNPKTGRPRAHLAVYRNFGTAQVKFTTRRWSSSVRERKAITVFHASQSWRTARWKTTRTVATSPSTLWRYASTKTVSANSSTPSTASTIWRTASSAHHSTPTSPSLTTRCA